MQTKKDRPKRLGPVAVVLTVLAACLAGWMLLNLIVDPFGVFGDRVLGWWSYDMSFNSRTAKFSYLEQHHEEFDSYVIGGPSAGAWSTEALERYFGGRFYNLALSHDDMRDAEQYVRWLVGHYEVKNLVLSVTVENARTHAGDDRAITEAMPCQLDGSSPLAYYARYLFASCCYGLNKLVRMGSDSVVPSFSDRFDAATGAIDYSDRDVEAIGAGSLEDYLESNPGFTDLPDATGLLWQKECVSSVAAIRDLCEGAEVNLVVVATPIYDGYLARFSRKEVEEFFTALGRVTPYWDFTSSSVSRDPRYFYDPTSFRTAVGEMMLARMFDGGAAYCPKDFGVYRTADSGPARIAQAAAQSEEEPYTAQVPILMYHHLRESTASGDRLEEHLAALKGAGYTAVTMEDLRSYVEKGRDLPDRPVVITIDGGTGELEDSLAILEKYDMQAVAFIMGCTAEEARALEDTGLVSIGCYGFDTSGEEGGNPPSGRQGVLQREGESEQDYGAFLRENCARFREAMESAVGHRVEVLAYPGGQCSPLSEILLAREGFFATVTTAPGVNTLVKGLPQTLRAMNRYDVEALDLTGEELLELLEQP